VNGVGRDAIDVDDLSSRGLTSDNSDGALWYT
jgi:hypothetical protein